MRDTTFLKNRLIAHRGYHNIELGIPENSMLAFKRAVDNDLIIELDVHVLKDGNVVVFHDDNLKRMTDVDVELKDMTYSDLEKIRLSNTDQKIPLLKSVLELVDGKVPIIIELKDDVKCGILEKEVVSILQGYTGKFAVKSFNPFSIRYFKKNMPEAIRGQLASDFKNDNMRKIKKLFLSKMIFNSLTKPDFISYDIKALPNKKVEKLRKKKLVLGWTIKNEEDLETAQKYCDNYICEKINLDK